MNGTVCVVAGPQPADIFGRWGKNDCNLLYLTIKKLVGAFTMSSRILGKAVARLPPWLRACLVATGPSPAWRKLLVKAKIWQSCRNTLTSVAQAYSLELEVLRTLEFFSVSDVFQVKVAGTPSLGGVVVATRTPSDGFTMPHSRATLSDVRMLSPVTINVRMLARWSFCKAPKQKNAGLSVRPAVGLKAKGSVNKS